MNFNAKDLIDTLSRAESAAGTPTRYVIALSGGLDSSVLAHALAATQKTHGKKLLAVHVDHKLRSASADWAARCKAFAAKLGAEYLSLSVDVDLRSGLGPEAAAREARYAAFAEILKPDDWLLSAHHREDQAETLLLNLLRGSGPAGVAGIPAVRSFASAWLIRPFLDVSRHELQNYANAAGLRWIDDPSNDDTDFDRNFLRHKVLPVMSERWPDAAQRFARSASLARDATELLANLADLDMQAMGCSESRLSISGLRGLSVSRQRNVLRRAIQRANLPAPSSAQLQSIIRDTIPARNDAEPCVAWGGAVVRRYRDALYLTSGQPPLKFAGTAIEEGMEVSLGPGLGVLVLSCDGRPGLSRDLLLQGLVLGTRKGGEKIRPIGHGHTRKLKKLLQEESIVPWMREQLPLLYSGDRLVAVADLWIAADAAHSDGVAIHWRGRPALH